MVGIDFDVAIGLDAEINQAVFAQQGEHVVEKRNAGGNVGSSSAIELDGDTDAGFRCFAVLAGGACIHGLMARGCLQWGWFAMAFFLSQDHDNQAKDFLDRMNKIYKIRSSNWENLRS